MFGATDSGHLGAAGVVDVAVARLGELRPLGARGSRATPRFSSGSAPYAPASAHHSAISSCSLSGCSAARSWHSVGSFSVSKSSQRCCREAAPRVGRRRR